MSGRRTTRWRNRVAEHGHVHGKASMGDLFHCAPSAASRTSLSHRHVGLAHSASSSSIQPRLVMTVPTSSRTSSASSKAASISGLEIWWAFRLA